MFKNYNQVLVDPDDVDEEQDALMARSRRSTTSLGSATELHGAPSTEEETTACKSHAGTSTAPPAG
jgi:hypothetical protein